MVEAVRIMHLHNFVETYSAGGVRMVDVIVPESLKSDLKSFFKKNRKADLITTYLYFIEKKFQIRPVLFLKEKMIYQGQEELIRKLDSLGKLWKETEIKIQFGQQSVNALTKKIYICPFTGKVFGDNTHPNPQDAIYDWVSRCPENSERINGLKVKRFYVSEDPEVIQNYIVQRKAPISKIVFSSIVTGKLFNSREAVIEDFKKNQLKSLELIEVHNQNRYQLEEHFLKFIQNQLDDSKITAFVEALSESKEFERYVNGWLEEESVDEG